MMLETQKRIRQIDNHGVNRADMKHKGHGSWERPRLGFLEGAMSCTAAFSSHKVLDFVHDFGLINSFRLGLRAPLSFIPRSSSEIFVNTALGISLLPHWARGVESLGK